MANAEHLALLQQGVEVWNEWREKCPEVLPDLRGAQLPGADLSTVNLSKANLAQANLQGALLLEANLQEARLPWTILSDANLQHADLTHATGLLAKQLAGANVSGARLPEEIRAFPELAIVEQLSQGLQSLFFVLLSACGYSILTIATTTHARLLTNATSSPLPIIGTVIPIASFYMAAPLLLLGLYLYLHLYYLRPLWEMLTDLPSCFPDGHPLEKKASLWLLNGLDRSQFVRATEERSRLASMRSQAPGLFTWGIAPVTLFLFWLEYLPRHDPWGTLLHTLLVVISVGEFILLYELAVTPLRGRKERLLFPWQKALGSAVLIIGILALLSVAAIYGVPSHFLKETDNHLYFPLAIAHLEEENISTKPQSWAVQYDKEEDMAKAIEAVQGAQLEARNLRGANARRAFLAKANLRRADLRDADLFMVQLQGANMSEAQLQNANLAWAWLQRVDLSGAHLEGANLQGAFLYQNVKLMDAHLEGANLQGAHLKGANLRGAHLEGANLQGAHLEEANLQNANLAGADLSWVQLQGALLSEAHLEGANLRGTNLQGVLGSASPLQKTGS